MQKETKFKLRVQSRLAGLKPLGIWVLKTQQVATRGIPDIIICCQGLFFAWELKVGSNRATELQEFNLRQITKAGGYARVVTPENWDEAFEELASAAVERRKLIEALPTESIDRKFSPSYS